MLYCSVLCLLQCAVKNLSDIVTQSLTSGCRLGVGMGALDAMVLLCFNSLI